MKKPIVFVSANYRVNTFGGLASREITDAGVANLYLKDQRVAMQWVQKYISEVRSPVNYIIVFANILTAQPYLKFGGNPDQVTTWGESAGSQSIATHMVSNDGNTEGLFHSVIMMSSGPAKW
jgi:acetylcholinesterase